MTTFKNLAGVKSEESFTQPLVDRVIYRQDLYKAMGVTSETLRRWLKEGKMPNADVQLSVRTVGWRLSTLHKAGIRVI